MTAPRVIAERYALIEKVGSGGMGEVWRAQHVNLNSFFAVKLLSGAAATLETTRARFLKEAQITAQLKSKNAVQVYDFGVTDGAVPYLVMEFISGETLEERVERGTLPPDEVVSILRDAARALDRAHALGIVHRDFKPANVILSRDEDGAKIAKVLDFGVAKLVGELETVEQPQEASDGPVTSFTRTGTLAGTPAYMAPEQIDRAAEVGPETDLWALGVVAYECLTGRMPFETDDMTTLFGLIRDAAFLAPSEARPGLPPALDGWFKRACARRPGDRFRSASEAVSALAEALGTLPVSAEPLPPARPRYDSAAATVDEVEAPPSALGASYGRFSLMLEEPADVGAPLELTVEPVREDARRTGGSSAPPSSRRPSLPPPSRPSSRPPPAEDAPVTVRPQARAPTPRVLDDAPARPAWLLPAIIAGVVLLVGLGVTGVVLGTRGPPPPTSVPARSP